MWFRRLIVNLGRLLPFILVFELLVEYTETFYSLCNGFITESGDIYTPISYMVGTYMRYSWLTVILMLALSYGLKMCWKNRLAIFYLAYNLVQKYVIEHITISQYAYEWIIMLNGVFLVTILYLGTTMLKGKRK